MKTAVAHLAIFDDDNGGSAVLQVLCLADLRFCELNNDGPRILGVDDGPLPKF